MFRERSNGMRLGGWHRLWLLLSAIYLLLLVAFFFFTHPSTERTPHRDEFYAELPPESYKKIETDDIFDRVAEQRGEPTVVEMPNGHRLNFIAKATKTEMEKVAREYDDIVKSNTQHERTRRFLQTLLFFGIGPCIVIYVLGWAFRWVYVGFKHQL
jgi:hypothetical protein